MMLAISLFEFEHKNEVERFRSIDDRVMGGVSNSSFELLQNNIAVFRGRVSLENNGGFASVRAPLTSPSLGDACALRLRVKTDGKSYKLKLFNSKTFDSVAYEQSFSTPPESSEEIELPFASFAAMWRGRSVPDAPTFDSNKITALGLMVSDKQAGKFELLIDWIRAC
jgi:monofunctional biosynthetic peptidoglycan transglycosylase